MINLPASTGLLQLVTGGGQTIHVHVSFVDQNTSTGATTPGSQNTTIAATTTTTICSSPAASTVRNVKDVIISNTDASVTVNVTVKHTDGTTPVNLPLVPLAAGASLIYNDLGGWEVLQGGQLLSGALGVGTVARINEGPDGKGWAFLGSATGATTTVGPVIWTGTYQQFMVRYWIQGYNGGTPIGRFQCGGSAISQTALTNSLSMSEGVTAPTTQIGGSAVPGVPLAVTASNIGRSGTIMVDGASGQVKSIEVNGRNVTPAIASAPTLYRAVSFFSDLGTNLNLQRMQLAVYDTLIAVAVSAQTFTAGTYLAVWGRNTD